MNGKPVFGKQNVEPLVEAPYQVWSGCDAMVAEKSVMNIWHLTMLIMSENK